MPLRHSDLYHRWELDTREASCQGLEGLLSPPSEWPSFLDAPAPVVVEEPLTLSGGEIPEVGAPTLGAPETANVAAPPVEKPGAGAPAGGMKDLPETQLPENLRAEIENFLNRDRPAQADDDEMASMLKGGFDPNVEPEK